MTISLLERFNRSVLADIAANKFTPREIIISNAETGSALNATILCNIKHGKPLLAKLKNGDTFFIEKVQRAFFIVGKPGNVVIENVIRRRFIIAYVEDQHDTRASE